MRIGFVHLGRENLGIEYLSSILAGAGHEARLFYDPGLFGPNDNVFFVPRLEKRFSRLRFLVSSILADPPEVLAFSIYTNTYQWALTLLAAVRAGGFAGKVIFGGIHATLVPDIVLADSKADAVVIGEAEGMILDLAEALAGARPLSQVPNLLFTSGGETVRTELLPPIADLDALPLPDKAIFESEINYGDDYLIMTGRGCPHSCAYCCESAINRLYRHRFLRRRDQDAVLGELAQMRGRYKFREVMFNDAMLFTDAKWLSEFLARYRRRIGLPFRCFAYSKMITRETAGELAGSGCYAIEFGLQTTNEDIRRDVLHRSESNEQALAAFRACDEIGLRYDIDHIFGLPGEKEEDFVHAARMYAGLKKLNRIKCHLLAYFPGTPLVEWASEKGIIDEKRLDDINRGRIGDFFHSATVDDEKALRLINDYSRLYKFLPLLGATLVERILRKGWNRRIGRLPSPVIILLQILGAIKGRDYRFWLYVKYYWHRLARHRALRRRFPSEDS